ncbi:OB-fold-containig protein [Glacieibacterium frigidum]|uniref:DUF1449 family protein n=1 Tax=Glacieibacterium frigidum TaxID=2593303 RepID=A0A552U6Y1_9SPHN|nr:OB-fold-containig protein [Glacieibacterium frigidum]TRW13977.1 DUF1449 family protein [Glacieibacterium frigidum]
MLTLLLTSAYAPFTVAFAVMIGVGLIELLGFGIDHPETDIETDTGGSTLLGWLGLGVEIPLLVWLIALLACFSLTGVALQQIVTAVAGAPLSGVVAGAIAFPLAAVLNAAVSRGLVRILPGYESTVISADELLMRRGTVLEGVARRGHPARARVVDRHNQAHYVMVEPHEDAEFIEQGETALLVRKQGTTFFGLRDADAALRSI